MSVLAVSFALNTPPFVYYKFRWENKPSDDCFHPGVLCTNGRIIDWVKDQSAWVTTDEIERVKGVQINW